jgi:hypothetical protein
VPFVYPRTGKKNMTETKLRLEEFAGWLANGERGISSEAIVSHLTGERVGPGYRGWDQPFDSDDFRRCEVLLREVPLARLTFPQIAGRSPIWAELVKAWDEIVALFEAETPGALVRHYRGPLSKSANRRIQHIRTSTPPTPPATETENT